MNEISEENDTNHAQEKHGDQAGGRADKAGQNQGVRIESEALINELKGRRHSHREVLDTSLAAIRHTVWIILRTTRRQCCKESQSNKHT